MLNIHDPSFIADQVNKDITLYTVDPKEPVELPENQFYDLLDVVSRLSIERIIKNKVGCISFSGNRHVDNIPLEKLLDCLFYGFKLERKPEDKLKESILASKALLENEEVNQGRVTEDFYIGLLTAAKTLGMDTTEFMRIKPSNEVNGA